MAEQATEWWEMPTQAEKKLLPDWSEAGSHRSFDRNFWVMIEMKMPQDFSRWGKYWGQKWKEYII